MLGIGKGYVYWRRLCRPPFSYRQKNVSLRSMAVLRLLVHAKTDTQLGQSVLFVGTGITSGPTCLPVTVCQQISLNKENRRCFSCQQ